MAELRIGQTAPQFSLERDNGPPLELTALRGRPVVLYFYPQDDTETCTAEAIGFSRLGRDFVGLGAIVIGVSPDPAESHRRFRRKHRLKVELGSDEKRRVIEDYGVWKEKTLFGRTYMGVERTTFLIAPDGTIAAIWRKVRTPGHPEKVLAAVRALQA